MWIPAWLGSIYSKLYRGFSTELFTFDDASSALGLNENLLRVGFTKLHSERVLHIFDKSRPRRYRLIDPENFVLLASDELLNLNLVPQERYLRLICEAFRALSKRIRLESLLVYGSVARGSAQKESDLDMMIVSDDLRGSIGSRLASLYLVEEEVAEEVSWLRRRDIHTCLSIYPLTRIEAERHPLILLDCIEDAITLFDRERFMEYILSNIRSKLLKNGAKRIFMKDGSWYWDLKPGYIFGEEIVI